jgi:ferredoxin-NADP reductase
MLLADGSGIVPLRSILRHRRRAGSDVRARLLYSSRALPDVIYRNELDQPTTGRR